MSGVRLVYGLAVGVLQEVGPVTTGDAGETVQRAPKTPNRVLRDIRENERYETRAEFAEAMARLARETGEDVYRQVKNSGSLSSRRSPVLSSGLVSSVMEFLIADRVRSAVHRFPAEV